MTRSSSQISLIAAIKAAVQPLHTLCRWLSRLEPRFGNKRSEGSCGVTSVEARCRVSLHVCILVYTCICVYTCLYIRIFTHAMPLHVFPSSQTRIHATHRLPQNHIKQYPPHKCPMCISAQKLLKDNPHSK